MTSNAITRGAIYVRKDGLKKGQRVMVTFVSQRSVKYAVLPLVSTKPQGDMYPESFLSYFEPERSE